MPSAPKVRECPGIEEVSPTKLQQSTDQLAHPLCVLFQSFHARNPYPRKMDDQCGHPILNSGIPLEPGKYCPFARLSVVSKTMNSLIDDALLNVREGGPLHDA